MRRSSSFSISDDGRSGSKTNYTNGGLEMSGFVPGFSWVPMGKVMLLASFGAESGCAMTLDQNCGIQAGIGEFSGRAGLPKVVAGNLLGLQLISM